MDQQKVLEKLLEDWGLGDYIMALGFDTTASNTGVHAGAVTLIEQYLGRACMWSACQRHVHELHIKHAAEFVFGPSTGPTDKLFKQLREQWGSIVDGVNYQELNGFEWEKLSGTVLEKEANVSLEYCKKVLAKDSFPREDYKELVELTLVWLGGLAQRQGFKFQWSKTCTS